MEPPVRAVFTAAEVEGHQICSAEIPGVDFAERPCYYKGKGRTKGPYVRVGDADLPMTDYELYSFEAFRRHLHDDERPIERAAMNTLDENQIQSYLLQKMERLGFAHLSEEQVLERCRILALLGVIVCHTNILKQKARLDYPIGCLTFTFQGAFCNAPWPCILHF